MSPLIPTLNSSIERLTAELANQVETKGGPGLDCMPGLLTLAQTRAGEVRLTDEELAAGETDDERDQLGDELLAFADEVRLAFPFYTGTKFADLPDWLKSGARSDRDFLRDIFTNLDSLGADNLTDLASRKGLDLDALRTKYARWESLAAAADARPDTARKVRQALDLRAMISGVLRFYGLTEFEIRSVAAGV